MGQRVIHLCVIELNDGTRLQIPVQIPQHAHLDNCVWGCVRAQFRNFWFLKTPLEIEKKTINRERYFQVDRTFDFNQKQIIELADNFSGLAGSLILSEAGTTRISLAMTAQAR